MIMESEPPDMKHPAYRQEMRGYRTTIYGPMRSTDPDPVAEKLADFRKRIDQLCRPIVDQTYKVRGKRWWQSWP
jgi:hypothetical protein